MIIKPQKNCEFSKIIGTIKKHYTYNFNGASKDSTLPLSESRLKRKEAGIWQRRFYEHIIRNEDDLYKHLDYIHYNPMKHYNIAPKDWRYSSFKKFVKLKYYEENWCNLRNKYDINSMNLE